MVDLFKPALSRFFFVKPWSPTYFKLFIKPFNSEKKYGKSKEIVTDKLDSYSSALCEIGYNGYHETGQYQNNQCENSHLYFRRRERAMCRFRSMRSLQKFTSIQCQFHNHLQHQRHFETRQDFKKIRDQSLSDWQNICAA